MRGEDAAAMNLPLLVAGGGIGGLATALALARAGFATTVLEKAPVLGEVGAGIQLGPNAFRAFDALGVGDAARAMAIQVDRLVLMDALSAEEICHIDLGAGFRARFGNPYAVVHRGDLHALLARACRALPAITLRTDAEVVGYAQADGAVTALLADGTRVAGAVLIGADGLWSKVRRQMLGDGRPRGSGHHRHRRVRHPNTDRLVGVARSDRSGCRRVAQTGGGPGRSRWRLPARRGRRRGGVPGHRHPRSSVVRLRPGLRTPGRGDPPRSARTEGRVQL
jgi:2-polyprenyl-6-methoxyphenol hydroxylase-like FAD-dependent oxidoreductase